MNPLRVLIIDVQQSPEELAATVHSSLSRASEYVHTHEASETHPSGAPTCPLVPLSYISEEMALQLGAKPGPPLTKEAGEFLGPLWRSVHKGHGYITSPSFSWPVCFLWKAADIICIGGCGIVINEQRKHPLFIETHVYRAPVVFDARNAIVNATLDSLGKS